MVLQNRKRCKIEADTIESCGEIPEVVYFRMDARNHLLEGSNRIRHAVFVFAAWILALSHGIPHACCAVPNVADGTLHACCKISLDSSIAVGDRGLILLSNDGGKTWETSGTRSDSCYYAVSFDDERNGIIAGGRLEPLTKRSIGKILVTSDAGRTWKSVDIVGLPRITGVQRVGTKHWVAWGDWSDSMQTSIFETIDGGRTWSPRPGPCGHCNGVAIDEQGRTLVLDRTGRTYFAKDGMDFQPTLLPIRAFEPITFCKFSNGRFWVGGECGQLFQSENGVQWKQIYLPGNDADRRLFTLRDLVTAGSRIWIVGEPGAVVWSSSDDGSTWKTLLTKNSLPIHAIHALSEQSLIACGPCASILVSRNGGVAWWQEHLSGGRSGLMAISDTVDHIPWELIAYTTAESRRHASGFVLHDQNFDETTGHLSQISSRSEAAGSLLRMDTLKVFQQFPIGDLKSGIRSTDLAYYKTSDANTSPAFDVSTNETIPEVTRRILRQILAYRPDVLVIEDPSSGSSLESAAAIASEMSVKLAGSAGAQLYSAESGIPNNAWYIQRVLQRSTKNNGIHLARATVLKSSNSLLFDILRPCQLLVQNDANRWSLAEYRNSYRISTGRTVSLTNAFDGIPQDESTRLPELEKSKLRLPQILVSSQIPEKVKALASLRGPTLKVDHAWEDRLREFTKTVDGEQLDDALCWLALESKKAGYWNRWEHSLQTVLDRHRDEPISEWGFYELMSHHGSAEVQVVVESQIRAEPSDEKSNPKQETVDSWNNSSPFANKEEKVQRVSFDRPVLLTPIARGKGSDEFKRLLSRWPSTWQSQKSDPRWAWLISSRFRCSTPNLANASKDTLDKQALYWPAYSPCLTTWTTVLEQEQSILENGGKFKDIPKIHRAFEPPYLDGKADDPLWRETNALELIPVWKNQSIGTSVRLARDDKFLYVFTVCPVVASTKDGPISPSNVKRRHDSLNDASDHIRLRIDIDRDYTTWFEFAWSADGGMLETCNDLQFWNPDWFIATERQKNAWTSEIAIPLDAILPNRVATATTTPTSADSSNASVAVDGEPNAKPETESPWLRQAWAISLQRSRPSNTTESIPPGTSDRMGDDQWLIIAP